MIILPSEMEAELVYDCVYRGNRSTSDPYGKGVAYILALAQRIKDERQAAILAAVHEKEAKL